jgi:hypothetical protein
MHVGINSTVIKAYSVLLRQFPYDIPTTYTPSKRCNYLSKRFVFFIISPEAKGAKCLFL